MFHLVLNSFFYPNSFQGMEDRCQVSDCQPVIHTLAKGSVFKTESSQVFNIATFKHAAEGEIRQVRSRISKLSLTNLSSML